MLRSVPSLYVQTLTRRTVFRHVERVTQLQKKRLTTTNSTAKNATSAEGSTANSAAAAAAASKTATVASPKKPNGMIKMYEEYLDRMPIRTKMATGAILWGLGDGVAQVVPKLIDDDASAPSSSYDFMRTARAVVFGFAIHAPSSHFHFNLLEWMTVRANLTGLKIPIFKTIMEQFVYWSWISNSMYHGCMGAMQGMNVTQIKDRISNLLMETQKAQWAFWIPVQLLNFQFVPVRHQLNVVLLTSVVWTALLSAWYPPETDEEEDGIPSDVVVPTAGVALSK